MEHADQLKARHGWDYLLYVTDLPRLHDGQPLLAELDPTLKAALVSLPALGGIRLTARLKSTVIKAVRTIRAESTAHPNDLGNTTGAGSRRPSTNENRMHQIVSGPLAWFGLLAGMVRSNRPGRLMSSLSSAIAAATAAGAFGVFYASIWSMADALSPGRMLIISAAAVIAMTAWLVLHNGLWDKTNSLRKRGQATLDNAATAVTLFLSVCAMYAVLYAVILIGSLAVISGTYLESELGHPVSLFDYAHLSWLAASLGTLAGALGSNFDGDESVREATYSRREHERRQIRLDLDEDRND
jgi:hypothetical protein